MAHTSSQPSVRSVQRAIGILQVLERSERPLRLKEISDLVDLHPATASRLLATLEDSHYVVQDQQLYRLGSSVLRLTHGFLVNDPLSQFARPIMQRLTQQTGLTSTLHMLTEGERLLTVRVDGTEPMPYQQPIGRWLPLFIGSGRTIAAFLDPAEQEAIAEMGNDELRADGTALSKDGILESFEQIRADQYHLSIAERTTSIAAISVPLFLGGSIAGTISLTGPQGSTPRDALEKALPALRRASEEISNRKSYQ